MSAHNKLRKHLYSSVGPVLLAAMSLATSDASWAACQGPGAPTTTQTKCLTAVQIPGNPLRSFDISWVDPARAEYYLADRSNAGIDIVDTQTLMFKRRLRRALSASNFYHPAPSTTTIRDRTALRPMVAGSMPAMATAHSRYSISMRRLQPLSNRPSPPAEQRGLTKWR